MDPRYVCDLTDEQIERLKNYRLHGEEYIDYWATLIGGTAVVAIMCALCPPALPILLVDTAKNGGISAICKYYVVGDKIFKEELGPDSKLSDIIGQHMLPDEIKIIDDTL